MMKKLRGANSMDRISELPKDVLQRILYFLTQEEVVRTSVLSKSWRYFWCTRPNLDFSDNTSTFYHRPKFISTVDKILQVYCDRTTCLQEFHLGISLDDSDRELVSHLEKWIPLLTNMGTKNFNLSIRRKLHSEESVELPSVVFGAESLRSLQVIRFVLDNNAIERIVLLKHLRSLHLERVSIDDKIFQKIVSSCPLIETLHVERCDRIRRIKVNGLRNLKDFLFLEYEMVLGQELRRVKVNPLSLEKIHINCANLRFRPEADFRNLNYLRLCNVRSSLTHLSSCKFSSLKTLKIFECQGLKESQLFIDAPNIVYFKCCGDFIPSISFATTSLVWYSYIQLILPNVAISSLWFLELKELLESLRQSKISLRIVQHSDRGIIQENIYMEQGNGCVVESLSLRCRLFSFSPMLNGVFCICRPRNIGEYIYRDEIEQIECLWKILMEGDIGQFRDLEEVTMEIHERNRDSWHPTSLTELQNYQQGKYVARTRFRLKWRGTE